MTERNKGSSVAINSDENRIAGNVMTTATETKVVKQDEAISGISKKAG